LIVLAIAIKRNPPRGDVINMKGVENSGGLLLREKNVTFLLIILILYGP